MPPEQNMGGVPAEPKGNGALVGTIIIILILAIGGFFLWKNSAKVEESPLDSTEATAELEAELEGLDLESLDSDI